MTNFYVESDEALFLDWRLHTVMPNGELSEESRTLRDMMHEGFVVKYETEESIFMLNPYNQWVEGFILDKTPLEEQNERIYRI